MLLKNPDNSLYSFKPPQRINNILYGFSMNEAEELKNQDYDKAQSCLFKNTQ